MKGAWLLLLVASAAEAQEPAFLSPPSLPPSKGYTQVVEVPAGHRLVFLSGQVPLDSTGALRGKADFRIQATQVFDNLRAGLAAADANFDDVVKLNFYIVDVRHIPVLREVRGAGYGEVTIVFRRTKTFQRPVLGMLTASGSSGARLGLLASEGSTALTFGEETFDSVAQRLVELRAQGKRVHLGD